MPLDQLASVTTTTSATTTHTVPDATVVNGLDYFLFAIILLFALFNAPRAIARFSNPSEWLQGHLLRSVPLTRKSRSVESLETYETLPYLNEKRLPPLPATKQPWHLPMLSSFVHPLASFLNRRVHEGYSVAQALLMAAYTVALLYVGFYQSNPFIDPMRAGWVAVSQVPFIYALATKNNLIGILVGVGYEKLNYLHRLLGAFAVVGANVHALGYIYKWSIAGNIQTKLAEPYVRWGFVALVAFDLLGFFATQFVRSKSYNLFIVTHVVGLFVVLFAVCYHETKCIPYVIAACVFYGLDHLVRAIKTRITTATLRPIPELGLTRVEIPSLNAGWRAGQHVRLRVLSTTMGLWGMTEVHPFTIASVTNTEEGLVLMCKKAGRWTSKLYEIAGTAAYGEQGREIGRSVQGHGRRTICYSGAMFVVGGSGVTFALSAVQDLVQSGYASNVKTIDVIWSIPDPTSLIPMIPLFTSLISASNAAQFRVSVFYTGAIAKGVEGMYLPPGITLTAGRPRLGRLLGSLVTATATNGGASGVFVGVCGPVAARREHG
ncbi:ferric reductase like transmembrane component-domain-containing protein [Melanogaster broomeanus]|nr:ferric reductase like transmembrane component-domain-containing protein [Melanogaster broomeanus]